MSLSITLSLDHTRLVVTTPHGHTFTTDAGAIGYDQLIAMLDAQAAANAPRPRPTRPLPLAYDPTQVRRFDTHGRVVPTWDGTPL